MFAQRPVVFPPEPDAQAPALPFLEAAKHLRTTLVAEVLCPAAGDAIDSPYHFCATAPFGPVVELATDSITKLTLGLLTRFHIGERSATKATLSPRDFKPEELEAFLLYVHASTFRFI